MRVAYRVKVPEDWWTVSRSWYGPDRFVLSADAKEVVRSVKACHEPTHDDGPAKGAFLIFPNEEAAVEFKLRAL